MKVLSAVALVAVLGVVQPPVASAGPGRPDCRADVHHFGVVASCLVDNYETVVMLGSYGRYDCRGDPDSTLIIIQSGDYNNATCH